MYFLFARDKKLFDDRFIQEFTAETNCTAPSVQIMPRVQLGIVVSFLYMK